MSGLTFHVLNGDALKERFPKSIQGQQIIFRECLCQGPIAHKFNNSFQKAHETFLSTLTGEIVDYKKEFESELSRLDAADEHDIIYCWFEYDLFCQVNFWFLISYLIDNGCKADLRIVLPPFEHKYSFAACSDDVLSTCLKRATHLSEDDKTAIQKLWSSCVEKTAWPDISTSSNLYSICNEAMNAFDRLNKPHVENGVENILSYWINELGIKDFRSLFKKFSEDEPSFGFGDLQLKYIIDNIVSP